MKSTIHRLVVVVALIVLGVVFFPRASDHEKVVVARDGENFPSREVVKTAPQSVQAKRAKQAAVDETQAVISADESASISAQIFAARRWFAQSPQEGKGDALVATVDGPSGFSFVAGAADVAVVPRKGVDWSWKMAPMNGRAVVPQAKKEKVRYVREQGVEEWFVNIDRGIEHGFTLTEDQGETVRRVSCRVMTELSPVMRPGRDGVDFLNDAGEAQLHYDGLYAYDATGRMLSAWMETEAEKGAHELTLAVDTTEAKFPVTIDRIISLAAAELRPAVVQADDGFGDFAGDGLDDAWQWMWFAGDPSQGQPGDDRDGDGQDNAFEFLAGSTPIDGTSFLQTWIASQPNQPTVKQLFFKPWIAGRNYVWEWSSDLQQPWQQVEGDPAEPEPSGEARATDDMAIEARKFYRLQIALPAP